MFSIGKFSKMNRITTKTLRHYDKLGLFVPSYVDPSNGYRFYTSKQLSELRQILDFKEMGFSLEEIRTLLQKSEDLHLYVIEKIKELKVSIESDQLKLHKRVNYIKQIQGEITMNEHIRIKSLPQVTVASMRTKVINYDAYFTVVPKMGDYMRKVGAVCAQPAYCFTIYHDGEFREENIDVEICEAVEKPCSGSGKIKFKIIDEVSNAVCMKYQGPYSNIGESYNRLYAWIDEHSYQVAGNARESYIDGIWNKQDSSQWVTEIQIPIEAIIPEI